MVQQADARGAVELTLEENFFGRFVTRESYFTLSTDEQVILQNNPERVGWVVVLGTDQQIFFALRSAFTDAQAFTLINQGDNVSTTISEDANFPTREIIARTSANTADIYVVEFIREALAS